MTDDPSQNTPPQKEGKAAPDFLSETDPFDLFGRWLRDAEKTELNDPTAMSLATVDGDGMPNVRMVLMKGFDQQGFVFYTNFESAKGQELLGQPQAALCFHWKSLRRQVRLRGPVGAVSEQEADDYYHSRPRGSQIGAWASAQSRPLEGRFALEKAVAKFGLKYAAGSIPRPPHWSGFRLTPLEIEFWHDRPFRLHDRLLFKRTDPQSAFERSQLFP